MVSYGKSQEAKMHQQNIMTISLAMIAMMGVACNGFSATPEDAARTFRTPSLELQVQPETGMFTLHTSRGSIPLLSHQTLEMPADNDAQNSKCTYEYQRSVTRSLQCLETSEKIILELTQDWPLFLVTKTLILSKQENPLILRYTLQAKQSVKLQKAMPVYCYFYAGQEMDRFAWETPTGLQTVTRNQERNRIFGTAARGAEHGRFAAFLKGAEGPGLLAAQPSKGTGQVFNLWRYEMPTKNRYLPGRVGFKSRLFEFKGELRKGELHVAEWQLASTTGSELK
ncbi:MAG: hypothetical protein K9M45_11900, partial [Kiritimatiellales bacterium]|nr:hypothetical protein [Kiritimatiellales bacterium]